jgi:hypothetical protein
LIAKSLGGVGDESLRCCFGKMLGVVVDEDDSRTRGCFLDFISRRLAITTSMIG